jgi:hypothetical protein
VSENDEGQSDSDEVKVPEILGLVWGVIGFGIGSVLMLKHVVMVGQGPHHEVKGLNTFIGILIWFGAMIGIDAIGTQLGNEVKRGNSTWATYWMTLIGITVAALTFLGITSAQDFVDLWRSVD